MKMDWGTTDGVTDGHTAILECRRTSASVGALRQDRMPPIPGAGQEERLVFAQVATEALVRRFFL